MEINPKVSVWLNLVLGLVTAVATGSVTFAGIVSPATATQIVAAAATVQGLLNVMLHGVSSGDKGPFVPKHPAAPTPIKHQ